MRARRPTFVVLGIALLVCAFDFVYEPAYRIVSGKASYSTEAVFPIPGSTLEVVLDRQCIHPFLAEYERTLIVRDGTREILRRRVAVDTGGYSRMKIYQVSPTVFFLQGDLDFDRYLLDTVSIGLTGELMKQRPSPATFMGSFDRDERGWRFIPSYERAEQKPKI